MKSGEKAPALNSGPIPFRVELTLVRKRSRTHNKRKKKSEPFVKEDDVKESPRGGEGVHEYVCGRCPKKKKTKGEKRKI